MHRAESLLRRSRGGHRKAGGFTLVETMTVVAIAVILLTAGIPAFSELVKNNRLTAQANALVGTLGAARSEAVARQRTVTVCGSATGTACDGTWASGWMAFVDTDGDGSVDTGEAVLRVARNDTAGVGIALTGDTDIRFGSQGELRTSAGVLTLCDARGASHARAVLVSLTGRVSAASDTDSPPDGVVDDAAGTNVSCS